LPDITPTSWLLSCGPSWAYRSLFLGNFSCFKIAAKNASAQASRPACLNHIFMLFEKEKPHVSMELL